MSSTSSRRACPVRPAEVLESRRLLAGQLFPGEVYGLGGISPVDVVTADFNGDGRLDLATANNRPSANSDFASLSIQLGNGDGTFTPAPSVMFDGFPTSVSAADFNKDGRIDLATANSIADTVSVVLGLGNGTFATPVTYDAAAINPVDVTVGDFNSDGNTDLVAAADVGATAGRVSILLGQGDGTLAPAATFVTGIHPVSIAGGDFDADGRLDLVTANANQSGTVSVLRGLGNGAFAAATTVVVGSQPRAVLAADLNADGKLDFATANFNAANVSVVRGNGNGTFAAATSVAAPVFGRAITSGDFNGDGRIDLAAASTPDPGQLADGALTVLVGNGSGGFTSAGRFGTANSPTGLTAGDFDADGRSDLAVTGVRNNNLTVLLGSPSTTLVAARDSATGGGYETQTADVNNDGRTDLISANRGFIGVFLGNGDGTFAAGSFYATGPNSESLGLADFNGDGRLDVAVNTLANEDKSSASTVQILLGNGQGGFALFSSTPVENSTYNVTVGDFNGDNRADVAAASGLSGVTVLLGNGNGTFVNKGRFAVGPTPSAVISADINQDGRPDLVTSNLLGNNVSVLRGLGDGTFAAAVTYSATGGPANVKAADLNADGRIDLIVPGADGFVAVLRNLGNGAFARAVEYAVGGISNDAAVGDFDGDHTADLAAANNGVGSSRVDLQACKLEYSIVSPK